MQRSEIIGCSGAGKSTLARALGVKLGLPVHHLDRLLWQPGWVETARTSWRALQAELCAQPAWIIDGNAIQLSRVLTEIPPELAAMACQTTPSRPYGSLWSTLCLS
jgi:adenylate kinase family enzyme